MNIGEVENFSSKPFLEAAEILVRADEPQRALAILDNLPAYYRDNTPGDINKLREQILFTLVTPHAYMSVDMDSDITIEKALLGMNQLHRGTVVRDLVAELNVKGQVPHIVDMGPGEYWLPIGLNQLGHKFTYNDISLLQRTAKQARELLPKEIFQVAGPAERPIIFVAYELIEHLAWPREIAVEAVRHSGRMPEYIFLSTPLYTYDVSKGDDWKRREGRAHLRAYTPEEFFVAAREIFPGYNLEMMVGQIMVIKGERYGIQLG